MKIKVFEYEGATLARFFCPGCQEHHVPIISPAPFVEGPVWEFNGDLEKPTLFPSLLVAPDSPGERCHLFVTDGQAQFLPDCHHALAGQTVDLPDLR